MAEISYLMAAIVPDVFCQPQVRAAVKAQLRAGLAANDPLAYLKAAEKAVPVEPNQIGLEKLREQNPFDLPGLRSPVERHQLTLENLDEPLEPIYFNLLDDLQQREGWQVTKLMDTVVGTHGSALNTDLTRKLMQQQKHAADQMLRLQQEVQLLLQQWHQWREQKESLRLYDAANGPDGEAKGDALWTLQSRWRRTANPEVQSDALKAAADFERWRKHSESETRHRLAVDRQLLTNQLHLLKLRADWLRPYLRPDHTKHRKGDPDLVTAFNTAVFELVLLVQPASELENAVQRGELPKMLLAKRHRRARPILIVELRFRAIPERTKGASYAYRGRAEMTFTSYALNDDELAVFTRELQRSEWGEVFGLLEHKSATNLQYLLSDLDELLAEAPDEPTPKSATTEDTNPFSALFSFGQLFKANDNDAESGTPMELIKSDTEAEQVLRSVALLEARCNCEKLYLRGKHRLTDQTTLEL
jgi:hypothetical protein